MFSPFCFYSILKNCKKKRKKEILKFPLKKGNFPCKITTLKKYFFPVKLLFPLFILNIFGLLL